MTKAAVLLEALESTPVDIRRIVKPWFALDTNWKDNESPVDVITRLLSTEETFNKQVGRILLEEHPLLSDLSAPDFMSEFATPLFELVDRFQCERDKTVATLRMLTIKEWQKYGFHPNRGRISLRYLTQGLVENDIAQTNRLLLIVQACRSHWKESNG